MSKRKIIKVDTDLNVTVHDFPSGTISEQNHALCALIGNGCDMIEHVMPKRLYIELGHTTQVKARNSKCVSMLVDAEFLLKNDMDLNPIGSYLYETDKHGSPILGNVLFVGEEYGDDGIVFSGIEEGTFRTLYAQLKRMAFIMKDAKEEAGA